jgi:predicted enzyme related to lactoylglutathione lyase
MKQGEFVWYELCTTDPVAAADFYAKVVGWRMQPAGLSGMDYTLACAGELQVAGIMTLPPEQMPPRPLWFGYIQADDVDAKTAEIAAAGGKIYRAPEDIPTVGRFAVVTDPQAAVFMVFKAIGAPPALPAMMQPGTIGWHELHASDLEKAWAFYAPLFGWTKDLAHEMGPIGTYQMFKASALPIGGMLTDPAAKHPFWLYYFVVEDIDAGVARLQANGGTLLSGPMEVPGGAWVAQANDPQGGLFALVGMKTS